MAPSAVPLSADLRGGHVVATPDGHKLYAMIWAPAAPAVPRAVVVLVHGLGEHIRRYDHVAGALVGRGLKVVGFDQRGFGRTPGLRGDAGAYEATLGDIELLVRLHSERGVPTFLLGHSLGGLHVLSFVARRAPGDAAQYPVAGVIASAPAIAPGTPPPRIKAAAGRVLGRVPLLNTVTVNTEIDLKTLSRSPDVVKAYLADPLVHPYTSLRFAAGFLAAGEYLQTTGWRAIDLPVLIAHGTADEMTSPAKSREFFDRLPAADKTYLAFPGWYHELHNEPEPAWREAVQRYVEWIERRLPVGVSARL